MKSIEQIINDKFKTVFESLGYDTKFAAVKLSDRPDLSDFQCNGALALARPLKLNPRDIAQNIVIKLGADEDFEEISIDGPGFINIKLRDIFLAKAIDFAAKDERFGVEKVEKPKHVVMDFGAPNIAKAMHVGHLRSAVIGEAVQRILRFAGDKVTSDVHFGDWGTPMGMIISQIELEGLDAFSLTVGELGELYKRANIRCKEDEEERRKARIVTAKLQDYDEKYYNMWKYLREISVEDVKKYYKEMDVHLDLWWGESDAQKDCFNIVEIAKEKGILELDEGAQIIRLKEDNKPKPPVIVVKSDGGFTYHTTDLATLLMRVRDLGAGEVVYLTDVRQAFHFEQVFEASQMLGIADDVELKHISFGTVNGADGKPFKTRDGGVMTLGALIELSKEKVRESLPKAGEVEGYGEAEIEKLTDQIAMAAIKFQDMKNNIASGYVFEVDDFAKFEGKTGPYIQYAIARINSIVRKTEYANYANVGTLITNAEERELTLKILQLNSVVMRAYKDKEPSIISDYAYVLAQSFSSFYNASPIAGAESVEVGKSRLKLAKLTRDVLVLLLDLLGIEAPEVMLKAAGN